MHVTDLAIAEQGSAAEGERDKVRAGLEPFVTECSTIGPDVYHCAMAASTLADVTACRSHDAK